MGQMQSWAAIICFSAVACSMLEFMTPDKKMDKIMRFVFGAFMIIAIITPIADVVRTFDVGLKQEVNVYTENFENKVYDQSTKMAEENIKNVVEKELKQMNVKAKKIHVFMDKKDKDCISISKIEIHLDKKFSSNKEEVINKLREKLNLQIDVIC